MNQIDALEVPPGRQHILERKTHLLAVILLALTALFYFQDCFKEDVIATQLCLPFTPCPSNSTVWMDSGTESNHTLPERNPNIMPLVRSIIPKGVKLDPLRAAYYSNITGSFQGIAHFHEISKAALPNMLLWKSVATDDVCSNTTAGAPNSRTPSMQVSFRFTDSHNISEDLVFVQGEIQFTDLKAAEDTTLNFKGIHFLTNGSIYGLGEPPGRRIDIRLLSTLFPEQVQNGTANLIIELLARANLTSFNHAESLGQNLYSGQRSVTTCSFEVYGQLTPVNISEEAMQELEYNLQKPTGLYTVKAPKLTANILLISPECHIIYHLVEAEGHRQAVHRFLSIKDSLRPDLQPFFVNSSIVSCFELFSRCKLICTLDSSTAAVVSLIILILFCRLPAPYTAVRTSHPSRWIFFIQGFLDFFSFTLHVSDAFDPKGRPLVSSAAAAFLALILSYYETQLFYK
ncbi:hypothetical protein C8J56DRAFT_1037738 [Mycena floridula]|nr:hypothetical protein C8J56DRAFT_1037738 [Mycena floridula]